MQDKPGKSGRPGRGRRWLWFIGLYAASLAVFTLVVYFLRWIFAH